MSEYSLHATSTSAQFGAAKPSPRLARLCDWVIRWSLYALAALLPLFVLPWTVEALEINKQLLLLKLVALAVLAWLGKSLAERKFEYRRTPVNTMVLVFLIAYGTSSWLSMSRYMSFVGDYGQEKAGFVTVLAMAGLYFVASSAIKDLGMLRRLLLSVVVGGVVVALHALLQALGLFLLPFDFAKSSSFNTVGTVGALGMYLAFIVTLCGGLLLIGHAQTTSEHKKALPMKIFLGLTAAVSLFLIALIDFTPIHLALILSSGLLLAFAFFHAGKMKGISAVLLPVVALLVSLLLVFFRFPLTVGYPAEVMPSMQSSATIATKTLQDRPLFGSGPGTFIFDYSKWHSADVNATQFWNVRFDRSASRFWTVVATTGMVGALAWVLVSLFVLVAAARRLLKNDNEDIWHVLIAVFAAWALLLVSKFLYSSNMTLEVMSWLSMAMLVAVLRRDFLEINLDESPRASMIVSFMLILGLVLGFAGGFVQAQRYLGEIKFAKALRADQGGKIVDVVAKLEKSAALNPSNDVTLRNLAQAYLLLAQEESVAPVVIKDEDVKNEAAKKDAALMKKEKQVLTDAAQLEKKRKVAALTSGAVSAAKRAADVNPGNVADWLVLGSIYQSLLGAADQADGWAVAAFEKAAELEPSNPSIQTELAKVFVFQSDVVAQDKESKDEKVKKAAEEKSAELLAKAADALARAIELKGDYGPAHYNMALVLDRQGKLKDAIRRMEATLTLSPNDVGVGLQLSLLYYRDGRKDPAMRLLESVVKVSPTYSNARWYLAAMYEEKGDLDKAIEQIARVAELNPEADMVKAKLDDLKAKKAGAPAEKAGELPPPVEEQVKNPKEPSVKR
ncbi:tetratricopeptide repeat protein [Candidatus Uhrbacteria bacterium]|nr:tetratricopeptide repeat protein [Candidatus Uhrbacteria bacterium]